MSRTYLHTYSQLFTPRADGTYSDCTLIVEDTNGNATTLPLGTFVVTSDLTPPTVTSVDVPTNGTYGVGDVLSFTVNTDEAVNVSGSPAINMMIGGTPRKVTYSSGSGRGWGRGFTVAVRVSIYYT